MLFLLLLLLFFFCCLILSFKLLYKIFHICMFVARVCVEYSLVVVCVLQQVFRVYKILVRAAQHAWFCSLRNRAFVERLHTHEHIWAYVRVYYSFFFLFKHALYTHSYIKYWKEFVLKYMHACAAAATIPERIRHQLSVYMYIYIQFIKFHLSGQRIISFIKYIRWMRTLCADKSQCFIVQFWKIGIYYNYTIWIRVSIFTPFF